MSYTMTMLPIVPQPYLKYIDICPAFMALAHLVGAEGMDEYTAFYRDTGRYVVLDNSIIENAQVTIEDLVEKANMIRAQEIILPDVYKDSKATFARIKQDITWLEENKKLSDFKLHVVPQGNSMDDWLKCAANIIHTFGAYVDVIGIPKHLVDTCQDRDARMKAIYQLQEICPELDKFQIHLLGCWRTPLEVLTCAKASEQGLIPEIRSCDSAISYVYARKGLKFSDDDRPDKDPIDFANGIIEDEMLLQYNLAAWVDIGNPSAERTVYFM